jgi:osmotically-inducible protein OsmY
MKTDIQLKNDVAEAILWEPTITSTGITVAVTNGVVTLSGTVPFYSEKCSAERTTRHVCGVKAIAEELEVNLMGDHKRKDEDLAQAVVNALGWHVWVPKAVQATVENGWVTLTGAVTWGYQRSSSEEALKYLSGVKGITNNITLKSGVKAVAIKDAIEKVLKRDAEIDEKNIKVTTDGGKVKLSGTIRTWTERDEVASAAWSTPGVTEVENDLVVSY